MTATCEDFDARPAMTVDLAPERHQAYYALMNDGPLVIAAALALLGVSLLAHRWRR